MKIKQTLTVSETADFMGCGVMKVSMGLRTGSLPFGTAIPKENAQGTTTWIYHIPIAKVEEYMGMSYEEFLRLKENNYE